MSETKKTETAAKAAAEPSLTSAQQAREMLESFAIAFMLMLLMRNCLGENYQIPTGSMAPTLQGRHMDVVCEQCGHQYRAGASIENSEHGPRRGEVTGTTCGICRYPMDLDKQANPNHRSFSGDRIIVSKLSYWFAEPERWDVIVFKCPADAKMNYIKRLVGLPGETLRIQNGDLSVLDPATASLPADRRRYQIARKPAEKVLGMLHLVDDTRHVGEVLKQIGWPARWHPMTRGQASTWQPDEVHSEFTLEASAGEQWLRYRHLVPRPEDWVNILNGHRPDLSNYDGRLITDFYAYNEAHSGQRYASYEDTNWVGDLALEGEIEVASDQGELLLDLVEGGTHFICRIDVSTGTAVLSASRSDQKFADGERVSDKLTGPTNIKGPGRYHVRLANVDDQLFLWVDDALIAFDGPTTYEPVAPVVPRWSKQDPGDFMPAGVGGRNIAMRVERLRVLRDVYYIAMQVGDERHADYPAEFDFRSIERILTTPETWDRTDMFSQRRHATFQLEEDQFFPLGDNSPQSKDARLWYFYLGNTIEPPAAVDRKLMIGKAVSIYWPHAWYVPAVPVWPIIPNYQRVGLIR